MTRLLKILDESVLPRPELGSDETPTGRLRLVSSSTGSQSPREFSQTAEGQWKLPPNPHAGEVEDAWLEKNMRRLAAGYAGLWIAIKGHRVVASSESAEEVLDWIAAAQIIDALVVQIPDKPLSGYIIA